MSSRPTTQQQHQRSSRSQKDGDFVFVPPRSAAQHSNSVSPRKRPTTQGSARTSVGRGTWGLGERGGDPGTQAAAQATYREWLQKKEQTLAEQENANANTLPPISPREQFEQTKSEAARRREAREEYLENRAAQFAAEKAARRKLAKQIKDESKNFTCTYVADSVEHERELRHALKSGEMESTKHRSAVLEQIRSEALHDAAVWQEMIKSERDVQREKVVNMHSRVLADQGTALSAREQRKQQRIAEVQEEKKRRQMWRHQWGAEIVTWRSGKHESAQEDRKNLIASVQRAREAQLEHNEDEGLRLRTEADQLKEKRLKIQRERVEEAHHKAEEVKASTAAVSSARESLKDKNLRSGRDIRREQQRLREVKQTDIADQLEERRQQHEAVRSRSASRSPNSRSWSPAATPRKSAR